MCICVFNCMLCVKVCIFYIYADLCKSIYDVELHVFCIRNLDQHLVLKVS